MSFLLPQMLALPKHPRPVDLPDDDGAPLPVDPDEGVIAPLIPEDPEHDRVVNPED